MRIQRTCRELDIPAVVVFSDPDRYALHVRYADEAYRLPGSAPGETYLNQERIFDKFSGLGSVALHTSWLRLLE